MLTMMIALAAATESAPNLREGLQPLSFLAGHCWSGEFKTGERDTHCFEAAAGGKMVTDTHKVRNPKGDVVYEGVSVYMLDKPSGTLKYEYFYSSGGKLIGYGWRVGDELRFGAKPGQEKPDIVWKLGKDSYTATPASPELGHPGVFVKLKPGQ